MSSSPIFSELWAKNHSLDIPYPLLAHLLDAAAMGGELYDHWLRPGLREFLTEHLGPNARGIVMWLVGSHDLGKANPIFQGQLAPGRPLSAEEAHRWAAVRTAIAAEGHCNFTVPSRTKNSAQTVRGFRRHEQASASYLLQEITLDAPSEEGWAAIPAMGHHGRFDAPFADEVPRKEKFYRQEWNFSQRTSGFNAAQESLDSTLREVCGVPEVLPSEVSTSAMLLVSGLTVLADRLVSSIDWIQRSQERMASGTLSLNSAQDWITIQAPAASAHLHNQLGVYKGWDSPSAAKSAILGEYSPRPAQRAALEDPDGLLTIMSATGSGKTEAALLRHAQRNERLMFLLPTMATSNALMKRVQKIFSTTPNTAALAHSMATIEDFYSSPVTSFDEDHLPKDTGGLIPSDFVRSGMQRLLASVTVGTVDQALKASLPVKWIHVLLLALANAHIVIDEAHTLDPYQSQLLKPILQWLGKTKTRVTLLSATLSQQQCEAFTHAYTGTALSDAVHFPEVRPSGQTPIALESIPTEITIDLQYLERGDTVKSHVHWVLGMRQRYPNARIGVICNRVQRAQDVASALRDHGEKVLTLHSAMTAAHRQHNADALLEALGPHGSGAGLCVVGTQAIEASLDIDLDVLSTDLCPSSSLIQRAGRVWRRTDPCRATRVPEVKSSLIHVVCHRAFSEQENLPYSEALLTRTATWLSHADGKIIFPKDCQDFVNTCTLTLSDIQTTQELDALAQSQNKKTAALSVQAPLADAWNEKLTLRELGSLTNSPVPLDEISTRFIEFPTFRALVVGNPFHIPGALSRSKLLELAKSPVTQETVRRVLAASINLRSAVFAEGDMRFVTNPFQKSMLAHLQVIEFTDEYDTNDGLIYSRAISGKESTHDGLL
ncbi:CRISPR-associated helicase/endonuclease Cas3 [Corynebacterium sp. HMSC072G08]|uniref:CRISPR-associated helicase/endonuclease Cas3 n=1 Tax=Corynebacterium sp. HMSC072G08 TaxID=1715039 RepID=UPI0009F65BFC|nr:CRISPR-associated helicase/endonuclease Cas3 [Corynebacterium sp. HMSC072G08]